MIRLTITLWRALCSLPRAWHGIMGKISGNFLLLIASSRKKIAQANIAICFPSLAEADQKELLAKNFFYLGSSLIETGIAWFWSDRRIQDAINY
ncbi:MAG: lipid A biosynthesis lauroyl acyltransferase, partial [Gammaproteobacteria bacterium]|nr:lipid A biosynthesis lauroyl acyltransferase [Gammaproteobacteria bacterium]